MVPSLLELELVLQRQVFAHWQMMPPCLPSSVLYVWHVSLFAFTLLAFV
jgi:hypothetical protein